MRTIKAIAVGGASLLLAATLSASMMNNDNDNATPPENQPSIPTTPGEQPAVPTTPTEDDAANPAAPGNAEPTRPENDNDTQNPCAKLRVGDRCQIAGDAMGMCKNNQGKLSCMQDAGGIVRDDDASVPTNDTAKPATPKDNNNATLKAAATNPSGTALPPAAGPTTEKADKDNTQNKTDTVEPEGGCSSFAGSPFSLFALITVLSGLFASRRFRRQ